MAKSAGKTTIKTNSNKPAKSKVQKSQNKPKQKIKRNSLNRSPSTIIIVTAVGVLACSCILFYVLTTNSSGIDVNSGTQSRDIGENKGNDIPVSNGDKRRTDKDTGGKTSSGKVKQKKKSRVKESSGTKSKPIDDAILKNDIQDLEEIHKFSPTILNKLKIRDIEIDGRTIHAQELTGKKPNNSSVRIYMYEDFLTARECYGLMNAHNKHVRESNEDGPIVCFNSIDTLQKHLDAVGKKIKASPKDFTPGTTCVNSSFSQELSQLLTWSYSTSFYPGESKFSTIFDSLAEQATGLLSTNGGKFQITSYPQGAGYKTHTDCVLGADETRDRFATILVYLQDVPRGGLTEFPELGISVKPKQGRAIVWNNMNEHGECEPLSVHTATPVHRGHKYILQRWYYFQNFFALGKRSPEPELPPRVEGQPRVSCDEYQSGSCRWYDEWNYDHLVDYQRMKESLN